MTAQCTVATRRWRVPAIVTLAAMATLTALTADAAARQAQPAPTTEATAPREAGEPIMAIVSIKSQQVTFYDADGWILRAPVSTGTTGRETPAGVFAIIEKQKDHHSTLYDDAWMPNMQRITWNGIALHVRHPGIVIEARVVVFLLLDDGKHARWRFASCGAGRHWRAQNASVGVVESDLLGLDRHDRHDRLACLARRRRLADWRGSRLARGSAGGQRRQCGHRRERHNGGNPRTPPRHGGLRRHELIYQCHVPVEMPVCAHVDQVSDSDCCIK